jgi:hypothetical protein
MAQRVPRDRPEGVYPPGSEGWEGDCGQVAPRAGARVPAVHDGVQAPAILASIARHPGHGSVEGARDGYGTARIELAEHAPPHAVDAALKACRALRAAAWRPPNVPWI